MLAVGGRGLVYVLEQSDDRGWGWVGYVIGADTNLTNRDFDASVELAGESMFVGVIVVLLWINMNKIGIFTQLLKK